MSETTSIGIRVGADCAADMTIPRLSATEAKLCRILPQPGPEPARSVTTRVLQPEHIVAISLTVGRPKDFLRVAQFLEEDAVDRKLLSDVLGRHGLTDAGNRL